MQTAMEKIASTTQHMHLEEVAFQVGEGNGYLDIRDMDDEWIRIAFHGGELLILLPGLYPRFTFD